MKPESVQKKRRQHHFHDVRIYWIEDQPCPLYIVRWPRNDPDDGSIQYVAVTYDNLSDAEDVAHALAETHLLTYRGVIDLRLESKEREGANANTF